MRSLRALDGLTISLGAGIPSRMIRTAADWRWDWLLTAGIVGALVTGGVMCTKKEEPAGPAAPAAPPAAPAAPGAAAPAAAGTSAIRGSAKLTGAPPEMKVLKRESDPFCGRTQMKDEEVMVNATGGLKNVLVRITKGVTGKYDAPAAPALVDQSECMYRPRVQGIMAGQPVQIRNSDQTLHNVHTYKGPSTIFNQAEIPGMAPITKKFDGSADIIKFKCDVHPWMTGYVGVSTNPFFAVTGDDGSFTIPNVPAGAYTVEAWHERFGTKTAEITVAADKPGAAEFLFTSK
jgi:plastocyanin